MEAYKDKLATPQTNEDKFITILKQETNLKQISFLNAVYLPNSMEAIHWSYYIYFYDRLKNTIFINDLNFFGSSQRLSVTNTIEQLSAKILPHIKLIQSRTINTKFVIPKFIYYYNRWYWSNEIVKQQVSLKPLYNNTNELVGFSEPDWNAWNCLMSLDSKWDKNEANDKGW